MANPTPAPTPLSDGRIPQYAMSLEEWSAKYPDYAAALVQAGTYEHMLWKRAHPHGLGPEFQGPLAVMPSGMSFKDWQDARNRALASSFARKFAHGLPLPATQGYAGLPEGQNDLPLKSSIAPGAGAFANLRVNPASRDPQAPTMLHPKGGKGSAAFTKGGAGTGRPTDKAIGAIGTAGAVGGALFPPAALPIMGLGLGARGARAILGAIHQGREAKRANTQGVDKQLSKIINDSIVSFESSHPGYTVKITPHGGVASRTRGGYHPAGKALDIQITDPNGNDIPNYQDATSFPIYQEFANTARQIQTSEFPNLNKTFRWGGYFSSPTGKKGYGAQDIMHFDLGPTSDMRAGSWEKGLFPAFSDYSVSKAPIASSGVDIPAPSADPSSVMPGGFYGPPGAAPTPPPVATAAFGSPSVTTPMAEVGGLQTPDALPDFPAAAPPIPDPTPTVWDGFTGQPVPSPSPTISPDATVGQGLQQQDVFDQMSNAGANLTVPNVPTNETGLPSNFTGNLTTYAPGAIGEMSNNPAVDAFLSQLGPNLGPDITMGSDLGFGSMSDIALSNPTFGLPNLAGTDVAPPSGGGAFALSGLSPGVGGMQFDTSTSIPFDQSIAATDWTGNTNVQPSMVTGMNDVFIGSNGASTGSNWTGDTTDQTVGVLNTDTNYTGSLDQFTAPPLDNYVTDYGPGPYYGGEDTGFVDANYGDYQGSAGFNGTGLDALTGDPMTSGLATAAALESASPSGFGAFGDPGVTSAVQEVPLTAPEGQFAVPTQGADVISGADPFGSFGYDPLGSTMSLTPAPGSPGTGFTGGFGVGGGIDPLTGQPYTVTPAGFSSGYTPFGGGGVGPQFSGGGGGILSGTGSFYDTGGGLTGAGGGGNLPEGLGVGTSLGANTGGFLPVGGGGSLNSWLNAHVLRHEGGVTPSFSGEIPGVDHGYDEVPILAQPGEVMINKKQLKGIAIKDKSKLRTDQIRAIKRAHKKAA